MHSRQRLGLLLMSRWMVSWGISSRPWIRASVSSWTVCGGTWRCRIHRYVMSKTYSIGFMSGEHEGKSKASVTSSSRNCLHTLATWGWALSCIRRNPGPDALVQGLAISLRISSWYLTAVKVLLAMIWRSVRPSKDMPPQTNTDPPPNRWCWMMLQVASHSPRYFPTLSCLSCLLIVNLLSSAKRTGRQWWTCQFQYSLVNANRAARCWAVSTGLTRGVCFWQFGHATSSDKDTGRTQN